MNRLSYQEAKERVHDLDFRRLHTRVLDLDISAKTLENYKDFLQLKAMYPDRDLVPTPCIDIVWHEHILDTRVYTDHCNYVFGEYLHHDPTVGLVGHPITSTQHATNFLETCKLFKEIFNKEFNV